MKTEEVRKWDEGPSGEVEENGTLEPLIGEVSTKIKQTDPLRLDKEGEGLVSH